MLKSVLLASVAFVGAAGVAVAGDLPSKSATAVVPVAKVAKANWTGFHIGLGGGANHTSSQMSVAAMGQGHYSTYACSDLEGACFYGGAEALADAGKFGYFGTAEAGYDIQLNDSVVVGILGNYDVKSNQSTSITGAGAYDIYNDYSGHYSFDSGTVEIGSTLTQGNSWAVLARLGVLATPSTLVYGLAGYSTAEFELTGTLSAASVQTDDDFGPYSVTTGKKWKGAFVGGAGVETLIADHVSLKLEYRYANYGKIDMSDSSDFSISSHSVIINGTADYSVEAKDIVDQSVRAVMSYRF